MFLFTLAELNFKPKYPSHHHSGRNSVSNSSIDSDHSSSFYFVFKSSPKDMVFIDFLNHHDFRERPLKSHLGLGELYSMEAMLYPT